MDQYFFLCGWSTSSSFATDQTFLPFIWSIHLTYPVVWWTVGATQMIWQPAPSMPLASQLFSWWRTASCPSILGCCPPVSSSVCLFFSLLALCPACLSWQVLQVFYMPVLFQFASLYCGQEVFVVPNGFPSSVSHLFLGDVIYVVDAEEFSEASHLHGLYSSLCVCC